MSIWTHIVGVIRFDSIQCIEENNFNCGNTVSFDDPEEKWDACNVPCGSEGSLEISYWKNPCKSSMASDTVTIFGDLRDYENEQEIIDYFNSLIKDKWVRQACFSLHVEYKGTRTFVYIANDKEINEKEKFNIFTEVK